MTVTIDLPPDVEVTAAVQARNEGLPLSEYLFSLVSEGVRKRAETERLAAQPFREMLAPVRQQTKESGVSDDELATLIEEARDEVWQKQQALRP